MKRTIFLITLLFALCAAHAEPVRILGIGNSFTVDALEQHFQPLTTSWLKPPSRCRRNWKKQTVSLPLSEAENGSETASSVSSETAYCMTY